MTQENECREDFEKWVVTANRAEIKWIGHSYANAYMAAQWEGWKAAFNFQDKLQSENERLRSALETILSPYFKKLDEIDKKQSGYAGKAVLYHGTIEVHLWAKELRIARAALSEGGKS